MPRAVVGAGPYKGVWYLPDKLQPVGFQAPGSRNSRGSMRSPSQVTEK